MACSEATKFVKLLLATANKGKIAELQKLCASEGIEVVSINDPDIPNLDVEETGATFAENAELKARAFARATELPVLADDSGLEVDAMDGGPGVKSARWVAGSDDDRNAALLEKLANESNRTANFKTVVCYLENSDAEPLFFEGTISGTIATTLSGSEGFGYDPLFIPEGYDKTFAELGVEVKNTLSHRARAFKKAVEYLHSSAAK